MGGQPDGHTGVPATDPGRQCRGRFDDPCNRGLAGFRNFLPVCNPGRELRATGGDQDKALLYAPLFDVENAGDGAGILRQATQSIHTLGRIRDDTTLVNHACCERHVNRLRHRR